MGGMRVLVANELRSYRETISYALAAMRPNVEVLTVEPEDLDGELVRVQPQLVVCSRVTDLVERVAPAWIELYPDEASRVNVKLNGRKTTSPDMDFDAILSVLDEAERLHSDDCA